jgi:hypothetical protein
MFIETHQKLLALAERYSNRVFRPSELTRLIRRQFPSADFIFYTSRDYAVDPDMILVSGLYDCEAEMQLQPPIEITLSYHPEQTEYTNINWAQLAFDVSECIGHEQIHQQQYCNLAELTEYAGTEEQEYLGHGCEIEAYGFSIAAESFVYRKHHTECAMYQVYCNTFDTDRSVLLQLEKQIIKYIKELELSNV